MSRNRDVTVIIPCFNAGSVLREAADSALSQRGGPPYVVVVDDGSTDEETLAALASLEGETQIVRQANAGPAAARNAGAEAAETPLLLMLDADDRLFETALERLRPPLQEDATLGFSYGLARFFGEWSAVLRLPAYDPYRLLYRSIVPATSLLRTEMFRKVGGYDPAFRGTYEDWDFYLSALAHGWRGWQIPEVVFAYRRAGRSGVNVSRRSYRHVYRAIRRKHSSLYARAEDFAQETNLGTLERLTYRTFWAWRPIPAWLEQAVYTRLFR